MLLAHLFQEKGCEMLACSGSASGDLELKVQGQEGNHHGKIHSKLLGGPPRLGPSGSLCLLQKSETLS